MCRGTRGHGAESRLALVSQPRRTQQDMQRYQHDSIKHPNMFCFLTYTLSFASLFGWSPPCSRRGKERRLDQEKSRYGTRYLNATPSCPSKAEIDNEKKKQGLDAR